MTKRDPWLTEREAAKELRVSAFTVRLEREAGRLGFAKLRRRVFYPLSLINAYKASITCPARSTSGSTLSKLSGDDVAAIRASVLGPRALAHLYAVHRTTIQRIRRGAQWT